MGFFEINCMWNELRSPTFLSFLRKSRTIGEHVERSISSCFRYGYVYIGMHRIKELCCSKRMELFKHHFMQISMMNSAHAHEQHVFVYNI